MKSASYTLIPFTAYGTATGNYDGVSDSFTGTPVKAASYYLKEQGLQTLSWFLLNFDGTVRFEGTLDSDPESENYFEIADPVTSLIAMNPIEPPTQVAELVTENEAINIEGNFTWIRARVTDFTSGTITKVSLGY